MQLAQRQWSSNPLMAVGWSSMLRAGGPPASILQSVHSNCSRGFVSLASYSFSPISTSSYSRSRRLMIPSTPMPVPIGVRRYVFGAVSFPLFDCPSCSAVAVAHFGAPALYRWNFGYPSPLWTNQHGRGGESATWNPAVGSTEGPPAIISSHGTFRSPLYMHLPPRFSSYHFISSRISHLNHTSPLISVLDTPLPPRDTGLIYSSCC